MEKELIDLLKTVTEEMVRHPGAGAQRAMAVIGALGTKGEVPWDRLSEFKVNWVSITEDDALCPEIEMKFYEKTDVVVIPAGYGKVYIHGDDKEEVHIIHDLPEPAVDSTHTICGQRLHPINTVYTAKLSVTCAACLAKVGV